MKKIFHRFLTSTTAPPHFEKVSSTTDETTDNEETPQ